MTRRAAPVDPRPASSVLLVRQGEACPVEVYLIRRQKSMRFLGTFDDHDPPGAWDSRERRHPSR